MTIQHSSLYYNFCVKNFDSRSNRLEDKIQKKELFYTYKEPHVLIYLKPRIKLIEKDNDKKSVLWFVGRKINTLLALAGSTLRLITHVFFNIITSPFDRHNWYHCAKNGEIALGYAFKLVNNNYGEYWIDLAKFDKDCYRFHRQKHINNEPTNSKQTPSKSIEEKFNDLEDTISKTPLAEDQVRRVQILKKQTLETDRQVHQHMEEANRKTQEIKSRERESFNSAKEAFQKIEELRKKLTSENIKIIKEVIEKIPLFVSFFTNELNEHERTEMGNITQATLTIRFDITLLDSALKASSFSVQRTMLKGIRDKKTLTEFIRKNGNEVARWYLEDLTLPKNSSLTQEAYALEQLKEIDGLLHGVEEFKDISSRILSRILCLTNNKQLVKKIQSENNDLIKTHFCNLFNIAYMEQIN